MRAPAPTDLLAWLDGSWAIDRTINGGAGAFTGVATFTRAGEGRTRWDERGHLTFGAYSGPATRTLWIVRAADGYDVTFEDGRPFHPLTLGADDDAIHHCGADVYRGTYAIEAPDALRVVWRVTGPRKDDTIASAYTRQV
jgi:hypothetical protein